MPAPVIVQIPLEKIMPNPHQPRRRFKPGSIQEMADSLKDMGQQTPAKVRPLTPEEIALNPGYEYMLIGGHRRLAGAKLAGLATLDCIVLVIPPSETHLAALMDNDSEEMDWWDWDLAIEEEAKAQEVPSQRKLAGRLGISRAKIYNAMKVLGTLNLSARELIEKNLDLQDTKGEGGGQSLATPEPVGEQNDVPPDTSKPSYQITEYVLLTLANLKDPLLVERALKVVLALHLTEQKAKKLVEWVQKGNQPEDFGAKDPKDTPEDPYAAYWPQLGPGFKVKYKRGGGYEVHMAIQDGHQAWNAAMAAKRTLQGQEGSAVTTAPIPMPAPTTPSPLTSGASQVAGLILWKQIKHIPAHILNRFFPRWFTHIFNKTTAGVQRMGVKNLGWAIVFTLFLFLIVGSYLISMASRLLTRAAYRIVHSGQVMPNPAHLPPGPGSQPQVGQPSAETEAISAPQSQGTAMNGTGGAVEAPAQAVIPSRSLSPETLFVRQFLLKAFMPDPDNIIDWHEYIIHSMTRTAKDAFDRDFYPDDKIGEIGVGHLIQRFQLAESVTCLSVGAQADVYQAHGVITAKGGPERPELLLTTQPVALRVEVLHGAGKKFLVGKLGLLPAGHNSAPPSGLSEKAVTVMVVATQAPTKAQGEDMVGKALNKAASQGVNAAADEAVKKLLPF